MAEVRPFRGIRYNSDTITDYDSVITPPFDVINPEQRAALAAKSPNNTVHLILPEERDGMDRYGVAAAEFERRLEAGIQRADDTEQYYIVEQRFRDFDGVEQVRKGFYATIRLPEPGERGVLGHEKTFRHKIEDRLALTKATACNFGAVFMMYDDPEGALDTFLNPGVEREPDAVAKTIDGTENRFWVVAPDPAVASFFQGRTLFIADGHHRFATACAYREERRKATGGDGPHDFMLVGLVPLQDPGLVVCPAHRLLDGPEGFTWDEFLDAASKWFHVREPLESIDEMVLRSDGCVFGVVGADGRQCLLVLKDDVEREAMLGAEHGPAWRELDVAVLHGALIEQCLGVAQGAEFIYEPDAKRALERVAAKEKELLFLLKGATAKQICNCAEAGEFMPQKATYLFPKLPTGFAVNRLK